MMKSRLDTGVLSVSMMLNAMVVRVFQSPLYIEYRNPYGNITF